LVELLFDTSINGAVLGSVCSVMDGGAFRRVAGSGNILPTITGTVAGKRYSATLNGTINTQGGGANFFPGDVAGTMATGGQYA
jgi:hypothetical protein